MTDEEKAADKAAADKAAADAKVAAASQKELLKALGVESLEAAQTLLANAKKASDAQLSEAERLKKENVELATKLNASTASESAAHLNYKKLALARAAETVGATLGVDPVKALQVVKLMDVAATDFDPETNTLAVDMKTFLDKEENKHFVGGTVTAPAGGGHTPQNRATVPVAQAEKPSKLQMLASRLTSVRGKLQVK